MKYSFWGTLELKSSQIWHKNVFKFFKFSGTNLGWGGQALVQKQGQVSDGGGLAKFLPDRGTPQSPPGKNPAFFFSWKISQYWGGGAPPEERKFYNSAIGCQGKQLLLLGKHDLCTPTQDTLNGQL